jgi:hypothetical protein
MELGSTELKLLEITTKDLLKQIEENSTSLHVKQKAFQHLTINDEEIQIQITVTRCEDDFLDDFQTEVMNGY